MQASNLVAQMIMDNQMKQLSNIEEEVNAEVSLEQVLDSQREIERVERHENV